MSGVEVSRTECESTKVAEKIDLSNSVLKREGLAGAVANSERAAFFRLAPSHHLYKTERCYNLKKT